MNKHKIVCVVGDVVEPRLALLSAYSTSFGQTLGALAQPHLRANEIPPSFARLAPRRRFLRSIHSSSFMLLHFHCATLGRSKHGRACPWRLCAGHGNVHLRSVSLLFFPFYVSRFGRSFFVRHLPLRTAQHRNSHHIVFVCFCAQQYDLAPTFTNTCTTAKHSAFLLERFFIASTLQYRGHSSCHRSSKQSAEQRRSHRSLLPFAIVFSVSHSKPPIESWTVK